MKFVVTLCALLISYVQGASLDARLIGEARPCSAPRNVAIFFNAYLSNVCSGALIHANWVLTSATCARKIFDEERRVAFGGDVNISFDEASHIKQVYVSPLFGSYRLDNDVALVELVVPVDKANRILRISKGSYAVSGTKAYAVGYGKSGSEKDTDGTARQQLVNILDNNICYKYPVNMNYKKMCSYQSRACEGDQGGPLILASTGDLIGLISINDDQAAMCGDSIIAPVTTYTNIYYFRNWIRNVTNVQYL